MFKFWKKLAGGAGSGRQAEEGQSAAEWAATMGTWQLNRVLRGEDPDPMPTERATAESWETSPMPEQNVSVRLRVRVSAEEMARIEMGHIPQEMEDKWFMYCDGGHIRWFRSWSGYCIFDAEYEKAGTDYLITRLTINRDPSEFSSNDNKGDTDLFLRMTVR